MKGLLAAVLALAGLQAVTASEAAASRFGGFLTLPVTLLNRFLDPTVPAIPDLRSAQVKGLGSAAGDLVDKLRLQAQQSSSPSPPKAGTPRLNIPIPA